VRSLVAGILLAAMLASAPMAVVRSAESSSEAVVYSAKGWRELRKVFRQFRNPVDGVVAGAFVDRISQLLDEQWTTLGELDRLTKQDRRFHDFILDNLNEAVPSDRANRIKQRADNACPAGARLLCKEISARLSP
jgi:hypothetical protein